MTEEPDIKAGIKKLEEQSVVLGEARQIARGEDRAREAGRAVRRVMNKLQGNR